VQYPTRTLGYYKLFSGEYQPCCCMYNCKRPLMCAPSQVVNSTISAYRITVN